MQAKLSTSANFYMARALPCFYMGVGRGEGEGERGLDPPYLKMHVEAESILLVKK